jgi:glycine/D-amino acid oxidase-like deaminating enzyme
MAKSLGIDLPQVAAYASLQSIAPEAGLPDIVASIPSLSIRRQIDGGYIVGAMEGVAPILPSVIRQSWRLLPALKAQGSYTTPLLSWSNFWRELTTPTSWAMDDVSPFEKMRIMEPAINAGPLDQALRDLRAEMPAFDYTAVRERWAGALMTTPDNCPILSDLPDVPGLLLATGLYYGLSMGPAAGEVLADMVEGKQSRIDTKPFRYSRFFDGTPSAFYY